MVTLQPVESNMISAVGYNSERQYLLVLFNTGKAYEYYDVPQEEYAGLMSAEIEGGLYARAYPRPVSVCSLPRLEQAQFECARDRKWRVGRPFAGISLSRQIQTWLDKRKPT